MIRCLDLRDVLGHDDGMDLQVDPDLLHRAAAEMSTLQHRVQAIFDDLRGNLADRGTSWEHGSFGTVFAGGAHGYLAATDRLFQSAADLATTFGLYSSAMAKAAHAWAEQDAAVTPRIGDT
jgi:uncharacterized protein YukE